MPSNFTPPRFDTLTPADFKARFQARVIEVSQGRLSDFSEASALTVISEAIALVASDLLTELNDIFPEALAASLSLMGAERGTGARAVATARFQLEAISGTAFSIPRGYRFSIGAKVFQTDTDLVIPVNVNTADPANAQYCSVTATALEIGADGNSPATQATILNQIPGLLAIFIDQPSAGGQDQESIDAFADRVYTQIAGAIGDRSTAALIQGSEFEQASIAVMGESALAVAVPELAGDRTTKQIAAMHIFILNPDGSAPTDAQIRTLSEALSPRAPLAKGRLYFSPLTVSIVDAAITVEISPSSSLDNVASQINSSLRDVFSLANTATMTYLDLYLAIKTIYEVDGVIGGNLFWALQGDPVKNAVQLSLPRLSAGTSQATPAKMGTISISFIPAGIVRTFST